MWHGKTRLAAHFFGEKKREKRQVLTLTLTELITKNQKKSENSKGKKSKNICIISNRFDFNCHLTSLVSASRPTGTQKNKKFQQESKRKTSSLYGAMCKILLLKHGFLMHYHSSSLAYGYYEFDQTDCRINALIKIVHTFFC